MSAQLQRRFSGQVDPLGFAHGRACLGAGTIPEEHSAGLAKSIL